MFIMKPPELPRREEAPQNEASGLKFTDAATRSLDQKMVQK